MICPNCGSDSIGNIGDIGTTDVFKCNSCQIEFSKNELRERE